MMGNINFTKEEILKLDIESVRDLKRVVVKLQRYQDAVALRNLEIELIKKSEKKD